MPVGLYHVDAWEPSKERVLTEHLQWARHVLGAQDRSLNKSDKDRHKFHSRSLSRGVI